MLTGTNDADLYVRYGEVPNVDEYDCRSYTATSNEICSFPYPAEGEWFITVRGYSGSADYELVASFSDSSLITLSNGVPVNGTVAHGDNVYYEIDVPSNQTFLEFEMAGTGGDADIYVKYESIPTLTDFDCRPYTITSNEICTFNSPDPGKWFIMINGYEGTVDYEITATHY